MSPSEKISRRTLISGSAAVAAGPLLVRGSEGLPDGIFALGVASGDPLPDGIVLWTRLTGLSETSVPVEWEITLDERFRRGRRTG